MLVCWGLQKLTERQETDESIGMLPELLELCRQDLQQDHKNSEDWQAAIITAGYVASQTCDLPVRCTNAL